MCWKFCTTILPIWPGTESGFFRFGTQILTDSQWGRLGQCSWKIINGAFDRLAKWWRNAVDRFELQSQEKILGPENDFPKFAFLGRKKILCKKSYQYPNSNSPLFGPIVEKRVGSFSWRYCQFCPGQKVSFFDLGPKYRLIPSGAIWTNVREKWLMGRLTVLPNDEDLLLTDLSSKVRKKF